TVQNQGNSPTEDSILFDQVYLSDKPNFVPPYSGQDPGNQWYLGTIQHDGIVESGGSYTATHTFQLTPEISGTYIIMIANTGHYPNAPPGEGHYTENNITSAPPHAPRLPPADLRVESVDTLPVNYSGEDTTVTWTVKNYGAAAWSGSRYWVDDVWFSRY